MKSDQIAIKASGDVLSSTRCAEIFVGCTREVKTASGEIATRVLFGSLVRGIEIRQRSTPAFVADAPRRLMEALDAHRTPEAVVHVYQLLLGELQSGCRSREAGHQQALHQAARGVLAGDAHRRCPDSVPGIRHLPADTRERPHWVAATGMVRTAGLEYRVTHTGRSHSVDFFDAKLTFDHDPQNNIAPEVPEKTLSQLPWFRLGLLGTRPQPLVPSVPDMDLR